MKVSKLLQRATSLLLALAMLFSFPAGVYSEGTGPNSEKAPEIPEGYVWRTLSVEVAPFEEDCAETEKAEAARRAEKVDGIGRVLELILTHGAAVDEEAEDPTVAIEIRGWMPENVTAQAELIPYADEDRSKELAYAQAELRFYDEQNQLWTPTLPLTVCLSGDVVDTLRADKMDPTVYIYQELPVEDDKPDEIHYEVKAFSAVRSGDEEKEYECEQDNMYAEVCERALTKVEEAPDAVCFEVESERVSFFFTARQPERTFTDFNEEGTELAIVGTLPRELTAAVAAASTTELNAGKLPGDVALAWDLSLSRQDDPDFKADATVKVALRDSALAALDDGQWELQLWQLRQNADPVRVKDAAFRGENLRFSASELGSFAVVRVPLEKQLTATDGESYTVKLTYNSLADIPANAELVVREILRSDKVYGRYLAQSTSRLRRNAADMKFARMFDITLRDPETGEVYQPDQNVKVRINLLNENLSACTEVKVLQFGQMTEVMDTDVKGDSVAFEASDLSVYVVMGSTVTQTLTASDGKTYEIQVSYEQNSGIPIDAELRVEELVGADYLEYLSKTAAFLSRDEDQLAYTRFFDITLEKDGVVYEPNKDVAVSIRLLNQTEVKGTMRIVHFGDEKTELMDNTMEEDGCLKFTTGSFSVYAITDDEGNVKVPRAFYYFNDGGQDKGRQIIKNGGVLEEPDHNEATNVAFLGWYIYNEDGTWGDKVSFNTPIQVVAGKTASADKSMVVVPTEDTDEDGKKINHIDITVKTRYTSNFITVFFRDANEKIDPQNEGSVDTDKVAFEDGETSSVYEIADASKWEEHFKSNGDFIFVGWSTSEPPTTGTGANRRYNFYSRNDSRTPITELVLSRNDASPVKLYPVFKEAHWLYFKTGPVGSEAEYVRPVYVMNGQSTSGSKPTPDPVWRGYHFKYWTLTPTFDPDTGALYDFSNGAPGEYKFNSRLTENTTLYAYWEAGYTTYTVITWKQNVEDDHWFTAGQRSYQFESQVTRDAKVGETVNLLASDTNQTFTGFHHKTEQNSDTDGFVDSKDVTVAPGGTTVLSVYYDRDVLRMQFFTSPDLQSYDAPSGGYSDDLWDNEDNELHQYVTTYYGLYGQPLSHYGYKWPEGTWTYYSAPATSGTTNMSYLGEFIFSEPEVLKRKVFRAYQTNNPLQSTITLYRMGNDGLYHEDDETLIDHGALRRKLGEGSNFTFTNKYDGYEVVQYRRYYLDSNNNRHYVSASDSVGSTANNEVSEANSWIDIKENDKTTLYSKKYKTGNDNDYYWYYEGVDNVHYGTRYSGALEPASSRYKGEAGLIIYYSNGGYWYRQYSNSYPYIYLNNPTPSDGMSNQYRLSDNGYYIELSARTGWIIRTLNLEIRYARKPYTISYFDSTDGQPLKTLLSDADGTRTEVSEGVLYGREISDLYPSPTFTPLAKEKGYNFNERWYSDQERKSQILFRQMTEDDEAKLWYYTDINGDKFYTGHIATDLEKSMTLQDDGRVYAADPVEIITNMPNRNLALYAGFDHSMYWVKIDPNGGYLNRNDPTNSGNDVAQTYLHVPYGYTLQKEKYDTEKPFVEDEAGDYYYHYDEFNFDDPEGPQPATRKAYYTTNVNEASDPYTHYRKVEESQNEEEENDEGFVFVGWYKVGKRGNGEEQLTRYDFSDAVQSNMVLRAMWREKGEYRVFYSTEKALDPNGNVINGVTIHGEAPVDTHTYAKDSAVVVEHAVMTLTNDSSPSAQYNHVGWYIGRAYYAEGDCFLANPNYADPYPGSPENSKADTFILYPVFQRKDDAADLSGKTKLILDANGGAMTPGFDVNSLPKHAFFNGETQIYYTDQATASGEEDASNSLTVNMDAELPLPETNVFSKPNAEFLGWAFSRDAKEPDFKSGQLVGVDNENFDGYSSETGNMLFAVWHLTQVNVQFRLIDADSTTLLPIAGGKFELMDGTTAVQGTEGGIISESNGYLSNDKGDIFALKTPLDRNSTNMFTLEETETASGYIPLDGDVSIKVRYDGTVTYKCPGDADYKEAEMQANDIPVIYIKEHLAICKIVNPNVEKERLFGDLQSAVNYAQTLNGSSRLEMLDDYTVPNTDFVTIDGSASIVLSTAGKDVRNPYRGEGITATVTRRDSGVSLFTVKSGSFGTENIILDGGSAASRACVSDGGLICVENGSLKIDDGTVLQNSKVNSRTSAQSGGGAIAAIGSDAQVEISGSASEGVVIINCSSTNSGGAISASNGASVTLINTEIRSCAATEKGGAIYIDQAVVTLNETKVTGNTAATGAGIYVSNGGKLRISGNPDFGGAGVTADGAVISSVGNFTTVTKAGETNARAAYPNARQDIYLAETSDDPASLVITGDLTGAEGSIWVYAESEKHYQMLMPFAVIEAASLSEESYKVFRNACEDSKTMCGAEYLTGQPMEGTAFIQWTGGMDIKFKKIDGYGQPLDGAVFGLYTDANCSEASKLILNDEHVIASSASSEDGEEKGIVTFEKLNSAVLFMKEISAPSDYEVSENVYVVLVGAENLEVDRTQAIWSANGILGNITQDDVNAQAERFNSDFELKDYAIFKIDSESGKAVNTPSIAEYGIMNISVPYKPVIFSKINSMFAPLSGAKFTIRSFDWTVIAQGDMKEFASDASGVFFAGRLPYGTYYLEETVAPPVDPRVPSGASYVKPTHYFVIQVDADGVKALRKNSISGAFEYAITNTVTEPMHDDYLIN